MLKTVKMSQKVEVLRVLVNARLTAAAEEIFALVERTIAEYEEELCVFKEKENRRNQQLMSGFGDPQSLGPGAGVQMDFSPESRAKQEPPETPQIKEEPEEQSSENIIISDVFSLCDGNKKTEHSGDKPFSCPVEGSNVKEHPKYWNRSETINNSLLQQQPTRKDFHSETEEQSDNEEEPPASSSTAQMETEADGDHYNQVQIKDTSPAAHNSGLFSKYKCGAESRATVTEGHGAGTGGGDRKYECIFCQKRFKTRFNLKMHIRTHTGEKPHSCSVCEKTFSQKSSLKTHLKLHTGEKPYSCSVCMDTCTHKTTLNMHMKKHRHRFLLCNVTQTEPSAPDLQRNPVKNQALLHKHFI